MNFLPCVANERNRESFHYVEFTKPKCLLVYIYNYYNRRKKSISSLSLLPSSSLSKSHSHSEKKENMYVSPSQIGKPLFSAIIVIHPSSLLVYRPPRVVSTRFFLLAGKIRGGKKYSSSSSRRITWWEGGRGRRTGWNGLNNVNYPAKRVGGPCIYPCRVAPAKIEENRGPSERGGWGGGRRSEGGEKERSAGLVRVSATLLARSTNPRPRRSQSDRLLGHPLPSPSTMAHDAAKRRASLSARIFLGLIRPLGTRFPTSII